MGEMGEWFASACLLLPAEFGTALGVACAVLAVLLLAAIALGFGPLRARLGLAGAGWTRRGRAAMADGGLLATWRLYRQLGRGAVRRP